jgi:hypothetical protein
MRKYIADTRAKGATPILCSLVPRKLWLDGHVIRNTSTYRGWTQQVAAQQHVGFVDLNEIIARRYDALGQAAVDPLFGDPHTHTTPSASLRACARCPATLSHPISPRKAKPSSPTWRADSFASGLFPMWLQPPRESATLLADFPLISIANINPEVRSVCLSHWFQ